MKKLDNLELEDFDSFPVWSFSHDDTGEIDYDHVAPLRKEALVQTEDHGVMIRIHGFMNDGTKIYGIASVNGDPAEILPGVSIEKNGEWFSLTLPPAPEFVLTKNGPEAFSKFFNKKMSNVFPIKIETDAKFSASSKSLKVLISKDGFQNA